ncbi:protein kinase superfamily protein [Striga asiatica]|uniref:Protein kinase superfamily protein n=1 Tax=Striga asiatica TaxID=4170 RepID=A0A5A7R002_STRAF|nr:protein kinase superfamily protein [Striga asiatica]
MLDRGESMFGGCPYGDLAPILLVGEKFIGFDGGEGEDDGDKAVRFSGKTEVAILTAKLWPPTTKGYNKFPLNLPPPIFELHMNLKTASPKKMPRKVAIAIPKMPAKIPGTIKEVHPLEVAMPQAVVGPPTFAFDASSKSLSSKPNIFPSPSMIARWTPIWTRANKKILGAVVITFRMFPLAPTTAKNT